MNNMKLLERVFLSIKGRILKYGILFIISSLLTFFVVASITVFQTVQEFDREIKKELSPIVQIFAPKEKGVIFNGEELIDQYKKEKIEANEIIKKIAKDQRVRYEQITYKLLDKNTITDEGLELNMLGVSSVDLVDYLESNFESLDGRLFNEEEIRNGKHAIILIKNTVEENIDYCVGDTITFDLKMFNMQKQQDEVFDRVSFEIIGILNMKDYRDDIHDSYFKFHDLTSMEYYAYVPDKVFVEIQKKMLAYKEINFPMKNDIVKNKNFGEIMMEDAVFRLNSADDYESFIQDLKIKLQDYEHFEIVSNIEAYQSIKGTLKNIKFMSMMVVIVSIIASFVLLNLMINQLVREKSHEIGIFISLGETKARIIKQLILEIVIVGGLGIVIFSFVGIILGKLLTSQFLAQVQIDYQSIYFHFAFTYLPLIILFGCFILLVSCAYPVNKILKMEPKKILSEDKS